jgi:hypothetical protein
MVGVAWEAVWEKPALYRVCCWGGHVDEGGCTPLHWFALRNHTEAVMRLLDLGAAVDAPADNLQTPLMWCVGMRALWVVGAPLWLE